MSGADSGDATGPRPRLVVTSLDPLPNDIGERAAELSAGLGLALSNPRRLGSRAASLAVAGGAADVTDSLRQRFAERRWDVNPLRPRPSPPRVLLADMDSTMISTECIDEVAEKAGAGERVRAVTERAMRGEIEFEESLRQRLALCRGLPETALEDIWRDRIALNPGAEQLVRALEVRGVVTVLLSGGYRYFVERLARRLGFSRWRCNDLEVEDGVLTGRPAPPVLGRGDKGAYLRAIREELGAEREDVVAIGDGANDLDMIKEAGLGVAWRPKPPLRAAADAVLDHSGLDAVLPILSIPESDFATKARDGASAPLL